MSATDEQKAELRKADERMREIANTHDMPICEDRSCALCEEYYALLRKLYEGIMAE